MFYQSDSISRVMPGKADCITVKDPGDNTPHTLQKRHMVMTVNEAYQLYKMKHGENVGHPTSCSVGFKNTTQCVRQCKYHSNMILMLESLHKKVPMIPLYSRREFLPLCVCSGTTKTVWAANVRTAWANLRKILQTIFPMKFYIVP